MKNIKEILETIVASPELHKKWLENLLNKPIIDPCWAGLSMAVAYLGSK